MSLAAARANMETSLPRNPLPALSSPTAAPAHREDAELPVVPTSAVLGVRLSESTLISLVCDLHFLGTCFPLKKAAASYLKGITDMSESLRALGRCTPPS